MIAMGIPGSVIDAILIGALTIHGLQPGPLLMEQNPDAVNIMMATILVANVSCSVLCWPLLPGWPDWRRCRKESWCRRLLPFV